MRGTWQFIGREKLFRELSAQLLTPSEDAGAFGVVLVGEAGVGKTRLLTELVAAAAAAGFRCRLVQANASTREVPLGCLAGVLSTHLAQDTRQASSDVLFHRAVAALVSEADGAEGRFLLAVDDLPELDGRSAAAIQQTLIATGSALMATARTGQAMPAALDALWREGWLEAVEVSPLADTAVVALASATLGGALADPTALRLTQLAGGNPLNLREVLVSAQAAGAFRWHGARWELDASFRPGPTLRSMVERRLGTATPAVRRACELVALAEPIALEHLLPIVEEVAVDEALDRGLIRADHDDDAAGGAGGAGAAMVRSAHPLFAEVLRSSIPPTRARRLAAEVCAQLPSGAGAGAGFLRHAILVLDYDAPADPELLATAARLTRLAGDYELAWRLADRVLADDDPAGEHHAAGALAALTKAAMAADPKAAGRHGGERGITEAFAEAERWAITDEERWAVLSERAWSTLIYRGIADARAVLDDERGLRRTRRGRLLHDGLTAMFLGFDGQLLEGAAQGAAVLAELTADDPVEAELTARATHAMTAALAGPSGTALASARRFFELEPHASSIALNQLLAAVSGELYALAELDGWAAAARHGRRRIDGAVRGSTPWERLGFVHRTMGILATTMGVLTPETLADIDTSIRLLGAADEQRTLSIAVANRASFAAQCADLDAAEAALRHYDDNHRPYEIRSTALADRAHAWLAHQRGDEGTALEWAEEAWLAARVRNQCNAWAAPALHDLVRFGRPELAVDRLGEVSEALGGSFSAALAAHARAFADGDAHAVERAAAALGRCGAQGLQVEALVHAARLHGGERGQTLCESARVLLDGSLLCTPLVASLRTARHPRGAAIPPDAQSLPAARAGAPVRIERAGGGWLVIHGGREVAMRDLVGLRHLAVLVKRPGRDIDVIELASPDILVRPIGQPVLDLEALAAYRHRALALVEELARARRRDDRSSISRLEAEAAALEAQLTAATALGGASRTFADHGERARTAVRKAIVRAIDEIEGVHPDAARHLRSAVTTGQRCCYDPGA